MSTVAASAGSTGSVIGIINNSVFRLPVAFADDATPGTFADYDLPTDNVTGGFVARVSVVFGTTAPDTLTVTVKDSDGVTLVTETLTATGSLTIDSPIPFVGELTLALSGNTTASATGTVVFYLI